MTQQPVYVRHRDRMVQESVFNDLVDTLIACRWVAGTTSRPVVNPADPSAARAVLTTNPGEELKILGDSPILLMDYFPEATSDEVGLVGEGEPVDGPQPNTLALDDGQAGDGAPVELGSTLTAVPYRFNLAFWASSVGVAQALLNDLRDRYQGRIVDGEFISLYDYNQEPPVEVVRMEVEDFQYVRDIENSASAPYEVTMFYGQLTLTDYVN